LPVFSSHGACSASREWAEQPEIFGREANIDGPEPVSVARTNTIPAYFKAVTIFEPLGNVRAETSAEVDKLSNKSYRSSIIKFFAFGIATALLSYAASLLSEPNAPFVYIGNATEARGGPRLPHDREKNWRSRMRPSCNRPLRRACDHAELRPDGAS
jgi:hypothetical protein